MNRMIYFMLIVGLFLATTAFDCDSPPPPPPSGFTIRTTTQLVVNGIPNPSVPASSVVVRAEFLANTSPTTGTLTTCTGVTNGGGLLPCPDRRVPASYALTEQSGPCAGQTVVSDIIPAGGELRGNCVTHISRFAFAPETIDVNAPPAMIEVTGEGMSGMPLIQIIDMFGQVVASTTATTCNGTWLQAPCPYLGFVYSNSYVAVVYNVAADGSLEPVGGSWIDIYGNNPPPDPPPDPCGDILPVSYAPFPCFEN